MLLTHQSLRNRKPIKVWLVYIVSVINILCIGILIGLYEIILTKNLREWNAKLAQLILILLLVFDLIILLINACNRKILNFIQILNNLCNLILSGLMNLGYALHWLRVFKNITRMSCTENLSTNYSRNMTMTFEKFIDDKFINSVQPECDARMISIIIHLQLITTILIVTNNIGYLSYLLVMWQMNRDKRINRNSPKHLSNNTFTGRWVEEYT
ncbi:hypothetical protein SNEBB_001972 [Seison nebaliae]|nr:hypothetical protein SNEBB_001972 [Seison nebaliae]